MAPFGVDHLHGAFCLLFLSLSVWRNMWEMLVSGKSEGIVFVGILLAD